MNVAKLAYTLIVIIAIGYILAVGKAILLPFVMALVVWFLIKAVRDFVAKIHIGKKQFPLWIQTTLVTIFIFGVISIVFNLLRANITNMIIVLPGYESNIEQLLKDINQRFELIDIDIRSVLAEYRGGAEISNFMKSLIISSKDLISKIFLVVLYVVFLLAEEKFFSKKIKEIFFAKEDYSRFSELLSKLNTSINHYLLIKTAVNLVIAVLSFVILRLFGVDFAFFWAFVIFLLNYIPTIGSFIATIFLSIAIVLQTGEFETVLWVILLQTTVQTIMVNIVEPKLMGSKLNVSIVVIILALVYWSTIWGVIGAVLCIPMTIIIIKVLSLFESTKGIAILLSERGSID